MSVPPTFRIEELLSHRGWVRALAGAVVADDAEADDLAQQVWLEAIERPPVHDGALRAWLARIVRRRARDARRAAERRRWRESASAARGAGPSAEAVVAEAEAHRRVVQAVMELNEPYRTTVLLRFFEDMPPREIAARMAVPVETVKTRLKRGLAALRERLDAEYGRDGRSWGLALLPLARTGGVIVKGTTKAAIVAAVALVLIGAAGIARMSRALPDAPSEARHPVAASSPPDAGRAEGSPIPGPAAPEPHETGTAQVRGEVWFASPEKAAAGVEVVIGDAAGGARTVRTDADGRFVAAGLPTGFRGRVVVRAENCATVVRPLMPLRDGERRETGVLMLGSSASVRLVVRNFDGLPVAGATIEGRRTGIGGWHDPAAAEAAWRDVRDAESAATTDAAGCASLADLEPGEWTFVARKSGFADASVRDVRLQAGDAPAHVALHLFPGVTLAGRVLDRDRKGAAGVVVWAEARFAADRYSDAVTSHVVSAADGSYAFGNLLDGEYTIRVSRPGTPLVGAGSVRIPTTSPFDIRLLGRRVSGTVRDADGGGPLAGAIVRARVGDGTVEATSGPDGKYALDTVVEAGALWKPRVSKDGWYQVDDAAAAAPVLVTAAADIVRDFAMRRGATLSGRVLSRGEPVRGARVMFGRQGTAGQTETLADADGRYSFDGLAPGAVFVVAWSPGWWFETVGGNSAWTPTSGTPFGDRVEVDETRGAVHDLEMKPAGSVPARQTVRVRGTVTAGRAGLQAAYVQVAHAQDIGGGGSGENYWLAIPRWPVGADGTFDVEVYAYPDTISVRAGAIGYAPAVAKAAPVPGSTREFEAHIRVTEARSIAGRAVADETSAPIAGADVALVSNLRTGRSWDTGRPIVGVLAAKTGADGRFTIDGLPPGPHQVEVVADGRIPVRCTIDTPATGETEFRMSLMHSVAGTVTDSRGRPTPGVLVEVCLDDPGTRWLNTVGSARTRPDGSFTVGYIPAGTYTVRVTGGAPYPTIQRVELRRVSAGTDGLRITVPESLAIRGRVVDPDGQPVANSRIEAWPATGSSSGSATTRADGSFEVSGLEPQIYRVTAHAPRPAEFRDYGVTLGGRWLGVRADDVRPPCDGVTLKLVAGLELEGVALGEDGLPLRRRYIRADLLVDEDPSAPADEVRNAADNTDERGRFQITGLRPGTYRLVVLGDPPKPEPQPLIGAENVRAGTRGIRATLGRFAAIEGIVVDDDGRPVARSSVLAVGPGGTSSPVATTRADGRFTLLQVDAAATYDVHAWTDGRAPAKVAGVSAGSPPIRLQMTAGLRVTGRLLDGRGDPAKGVLLTFATDDSPKIASARTDQEGRFEVAGLQAGPHRAAWSGAKDGRAGSWPCGMVEAGAVDVVLRTE